MVYQDPPDMYIHLCTKLKVLVSTNILQSKVQRRAALKRFNGICNIKPQKHITDLTKTTLEYKCGCCVFSSDYHVDFQEFTVVSCARETKKGHPRETEFTAVNSEACGK